MPRDPQAPYRYAVLATVDGVSSAPIVMATGGASRWMTRAGAMAAGEIAAMDCALINDAHEEDRIQHSNCNATVVARLTYHVHLYAATGSLAETKAVA